MILHPKRASNYGKIGTIRAHGSTKYIQDLTLEEMKATYSAKVRALM
jgi:hypothetical protein